MKGSFLPVYKLIKALCVLCGFIQLTYIRSPSKLSHFKVGGRLSGLMVSVLYSGSSGLGPNPGRSLRCVVGQDTLPS